MMLQFRWDTDDLTKVLDEMPDRVTEAVKETTKDTTEQAVEMIKHRTPRDTGAAIRSWTVSYGDGGLRGILASGVPYINVLEFGGYPVVSTKKRKPRKKKASKKKKKNLTKKRKRRKNVRTGPGFRRGNAILGGCKSGTHTQRAPGGLPEMRSNVSNRRGTQRGMVRSTLLDIEDQFVSDLDWAVRAAMSAGA